MSEAEYLISQITRLESRLEAAQGDLRIVESLYEAAQRRVEVAEQRAATAVRLLREVSKYDLNEEILLEARAFLATIEQ